MAYSGAVARSCFRILAGCIPDVRITVPPCHVGSRPNSFRVTQGHLRTSQIALLSAHRLIWYRFLTSDGCLCLADAAWCGPLPPGFHTGWHLSSLRHGNSDQHAVKSLQTVPVVELALVSEERVHPNGCQTSGPTVRCMCRVLL